MNEVCEKKRHTYIKQGKRMKQGKERKGIVLETHERGENHPGNMATAAF